MGEERVLIHMAKRASGKAHALYGAGLLRQDPFAFDGAGWTRRGGQGAARPWSRHIHH